MIVPLEIYQALLHDIRLIRLCEVSNGSCLNGPPMQPHVRAVGRESYSRSSIRRAREPRYSASKPLIALASGRNAPAERPTAQKPTFLSIPILETLLPFFSPKYIFPRSRPCPLYSAPAAVPLAKSRRRAVPTRLLAPTARFIEGPISLRRCAPSCSLLHLLLFRRIHLPASHI